MSTALKVSATGWLATALGHTISAKDWQQTPQFRALPNLPYACGKVGWYQGSAFFLATALLNYSWAENPALLEQPINKAIAGLLTAIMWASSGWYFKRGVLANGVATAVVGGLNAWAAFLA